MIIKIDYSSLGFWIAWDVENPKPRLGVCACLHRLYTLSRKYFPEAEIELSDAAEICLSFPDPYIGSALHKHDLGVSHGPRID